MMEREKIILIHFPFTCNKCYVRNEMHGALPNEGLRSETFSNIKFIASKRTVQEMHLFNAPVYQKLKHEPSQSRCA